MYQVFIAEDEPAALQHLCTIIKIKCPNFQVTGTAENGKDALEQLGELKPDILITDVKMPVMDGYEATIEIRKSSQTVPIIAVTAYAFAEDEARVLRSGFDAYVSKPINASIRDIVRLHLNKQR